MLLLVVITTDQLFYHYSKIVNFIIGNLDENTFFGIYINVIMAQMNKSITLQHCVAELLYCLTICRSQVFIIG